MTATIQKIELKPTWTMSKVQGEVANMKAQMCFTAHSVIEKLSPEALTEYTNKMTEMKLGYFTKLNVKTPMDLVKAFGEYEVNLTGSNIEIYGTDTEAGLTFKTCASWQATKELMNPTVAKEKEMMENMNSFIGKLGKHFGFTGTTKFENEMLTVTFTK